MYCMNTQMMNQRQYDEDMAESRYEAAESRAIELMAAGEDCDPCDAYNLSEALSEANHDAMKALSQLMREGKYADAAIFIKGISHTYWSEVAEEQAWSELS